MQCSVSRLPHSLQHTINVTPSHNTSPPSSKNTTVYCGLQLPKQSTSILSIVWPSYASSSTKVHCLPWIPTRSSSIPSSLWVLYGNLFPFSFNTLQCHQSLHSVVLLFSLFLPHNVSSIEFQCHKFCLWSRLQVPSFFNYLPHLTRNTHRNVTPLIEFQ